MNFIKQLQAENQTLNDRLEDAQAELIAFRVHLGSAKFHGIETDGSTRAWIATADVLTRLTHISDELRGVA